MTLVALDRQGYRPALGYSFAERTDGHGKGTIEVHAVCLPPDWWREEVEPKPEGRSKRLRFLIAVFVLSALGVGSGIIHFLVSKGLL